MFSFLKKTISFILVSKKIESVPLEPKTPVPKTMQTKAGNYFSPILHLNNAVYK